MRGKRAAVLPVSYLFLTPSSSPPPPLRAPRLAVSVLPLKEPLEQKRSAQLADIQKKWDTHVQQRRRGGTHACVSIRGALN